VGRWEIPHGVLAAALDYWSGDSVVCLNGGEEMGVDLCLGRRRGWFILFYEWVGVG